VAIIARRRSPTAPHPSGQAVPDKSSAAFQARARQQNVGDRSSTNSAAESLAAKDPLASIRTLYKKKDGPLVWEPSSATGDLPAPSGAARFALTVTRIWSAGNLA
jgi:hypothetical protein